MKFKPKRFEPKRINIKKISEEEFRANYEKQMARNAAIGASLKKIFRPITKLLSPIIDPFRNNIAFVKDEISELPQMKNLSEEDKEGNKKDFTSKIGYAISLGFKEKEIFFFGVMQWIFVILGCILWLQMLSWVPQPLWDAVQECIDNGNENCTTVVDIPLTLWGYVCILLVAFPLGIFSSAMGTAHFLHKQNQKSTVIKCMQAALSNAWTTWTFHFIDGYITVRQIGNRLPQDSQGSAFLQEIIDARRAKEEALYYAWKIGTAGVLPNMVLGNNLIASGKNSIMFVKDNFVEILKLRAAYSSICWVVGISAYVGGIVVMIFMGDAIYAESGGLAIVKIYQFMLIPVAFATLIVIIFLRPIYVLTVCNLYSDYLHSIDEKPVLPNDPSVGKKAFILFGLICLLVILVIVFRDQIGLTDLFSSTEIGKSFW